MGILTLGSETDTLDNTGSVTGTMPVPVLGESLLADISARFVGVLPQIPPLFSNVQVAGRRGHEIARAGEKVELKPRMVAIHALQLFALNHNQLRLECRVSAGTYIRALARDIATALGTCGHLSALRRTAIGPFLVGTKNAPAEPYGVVIEQLSDAEALSFFPSLALSKEQARRFYQGQAPLVAPATEQGIRRIFAEGVFLGLGRLERGRLRVEKIYPQRSVFP